MSTFEPSPSELAQRVRELEQHITGSGLGGHRSAPSPVDVAVDYTARARQATAREHNIAAAPQPFREIAALDPESTEILAVNLISNQVMTSLGNFELEPQDIAQTAMIAHEVVRRNLQKTLDALGMKYGLPELRAMINQQEQQIRATVENANAGRVATAQPAGVVDLQEQVAKIVRENVGAMSEGNNGASMAEVLEDDDIDETRDAPPIPLNRRRPRRR